MKTLLFFLFLIGSSMAYEPPIPGKVMATVSSAFAGGLVIDYTQNKKIHRGDRLSIEWGDGQYFTKVLSVHRKTIYTDYSPISIEVEKGAIVRLVK